MKKSQPTKRFDPDMNPEQALEAIGTAELHKDETMIGIVYTSGIKSIMKEFRCRWLGYEMAVAKFMIPAIAQEPFVTCELSVEPDRSAYIVFTDGNNNILHTKFIEYTDFPAAGICLWICENVILLPSEY
jgi:hypothetical protein